ncbi:cytochrome c oxidase subunit 4 [Cellulomonas xiejunii]|uniref:Cytochrome c oxidase polypeptide 4 n=1 Tax=Cellulomonas xiejunii TaxID=2968083 RepID=A0ABY5KIF8_9CELL|nr:cytochrome c oxidase subunit 4 [Cellulomonas xiejunii]MCC2313243.1 cytochrome c oxidase subunit 4 [Cellulomonas xiejunii]MCC2319940.1 cytochrome c oxidase subunit 4 [Cellulomonas xiejunii]UUI70262.1 cytochrome c oxidase subunit 4 [Cellulomonas xiejunii]
MKIEAKLFLYGVLFFFPVGLIYGLWSDGEAVGTVSIPLVGGLVGMIGGYFALLARRIDARPEDDELGEIEQGAGNQGTFSPWSWWPLVVALGASVAFLSLAVGWWLMVPAAVLGVIGLVGWMFEYSRGQHAH